MKKKEGENGRNRAPGVERNALRSENAAAMRRKAHASEEELRSRLQRTATPAAVIDVKT